MEPHKNVRPYPFQLLTLVQNIDHRGFDSVVTAPFSLTTSSSAVIKIIGPSTDPIIRINTSFGLIGLMAWGALSLGRF